MKEPNLLIIWLFALIIPISSYRQDTTRFTIPIGVPVYRDSSDMSSKVNFSKATAANIVNYSKGSRYYPFQYKNVTYYVHSYYLTGGRPLDSSYTGGDIISYYISLYSKPSKITDYTSGDYLSKTYVWHCAAGKCRSVDFVRKNGKWAKDSEYTSDCLK